VLKKQKLFIAAIAILIVLTIIGFATSWGEGKQEVEVKSVEEVINSAIGTEKEETTGEKPLVSGIDEPELAEAACSLIEEGKFGAAGQLLDASTAVGDANAPMVGQLKGIVGEWKKLEQRRAKQREEAYKKQLAAFERVKAGGKADVNDAMVSNDLDVNEVNEPNGVAAILAAVIRTNEYTDEQQKKALIADPCVVRAVETAKREAEALEQKGKWLEAYLNYYSLLAAMEPNNKEYSEHADKLIEKAEIVAAFTDNPCETVGERFEGVKRRIFERAVDELNFKYINKIDYKEMAAKGIGRCRALTEVVGTLAGQSTRAQEHKSTSEKEQKGTDEPNLATLGKVFKDFKAEAGAIEGLQAGLLAIEQDINGWEEDGSKQKFIGVFRKALELNLATAKLPEGVVISEFAEASFETLDPYTVIVWPTNVEEFEQAMTNEFTGIGIEITKQKGQLTVASLLPDTPAYYSGLDAGDVIEGVNGLATKDMPLSCAVKNIKGPAGTKVTLTVKRTGEQQTRDIIITRAKITNPTIKGWERTQRGEWRYIVDPNDRIGYVRVTSFSEKTASDLESVLDSLESAGIRGLILDLRGNSGGFFESAKAVSDMFLDKGIIVITRSRYGPPAYEVAHKRGTHPNYPMVVLTNPGSASASEIVAGALCDPTHKRATIVGERTHGKGVVQGVTDYPGEGAQLKYTMAYYQLPSGKKVKSKEEARKDKTNDWGIAPNVTVELRSDEYRRMFDVQRDNDVLVRAGHDSEAAPVNKHSLEETIEADPQLETAIMVVRSKLIREEAQSEKSQNANTKSQTSSNERIIKFQNEDVQVLTNATGKKAA
jgi:carboxyl-terminal processing protease